MKGEQGTNYQDTIREVFEWAELRENQGILREEGEYQDPFVALAVIQ